MYKREKRSGYGNASELYNELLGIYFFEYEALSEAKRRKLGNKYYPTNLFLETYDYDDLFKDE